MRFALHPIDDDVRPGEPLWRHHFGIGPLPEVLITITRVAEVLISVGLRGVNAKTVVPLAVSSNVYNISGWAIGMAGMSCIMPTWTNRTSLTDRSDDVEWMIFRFFDGVAYHFDTASDIETSIAEACKAIITTRIERTTATVPAVLDFSR